MALNEYIDLTCQNPNEAAFYYPIILYYIAIIVFIYIVIYFYRKTKIDKQNLGNTSCSLVIEMNHSISFLANKKMLTFKFLLAYVLTRSSMWAKSPYLYTLYNKYHGFGIGEIGILYIIDAVFAFISGPIFGGMADKYGRKLFSMLYCVFVVLNLFLRVTGSQPLAYVAQMLTGLGSTLLTTPFESWIVYEATALFQENKQEQEYYLKRLFKNQALYDAICSLVVSLISAILYSNFGILAPIFFAIFLATSAFFVIMLLWAENKPNCLSTKSNYESFKDAAEELKQRDVLCIGIIESIYAAALNLYIFIWTPVLQMSTKDGELNVGFVFVVFVIMTLVGTAMFELLVINIKTKYFFSMVLSLTLEACCFFVIYFWESFTVRLVFISLIDVI